MITSDKYRQLKCLLSLKVNFQVNILIFRKEKKKKKANFPRYSENLTNIFWSSDTRDFGETLWINSRLLGQI